VSRQPPAKKLSPANSHPGGADATLGYVLDFMRLLWAIDHHLTTISKRMERTLGVTGPQRLVVRIVGQRPGISAGDLAATMHVHPSTLTGVVRRLTERGLLERKPDPFDGRRALFRLTRKGLHVDGIRSGTVEARVRAALESLPRAEAAAASRALSHLAEVLSRR
jgi:MarR family transcriptional regulator, organic hydroperoxide resistance regulator